MKINLLLSYPKSGSHWVSYCLRKLTKKKVSDIKDATEVFQFVKIHGGYELSGKDAKINSCIMIVRDPIEVICSYIAADKRIPIKNFCELHVNEFPFVRFMKECVNYKYNFTCANKIGASVYYVNYENLILHPYSELEKLCSFMNTKKISEICWSTFGKYMKNIHEHQKKSLAQKRKPSAMELNTVVGMYIPESNLSFFKNNLRYDVREKLFEIIYNGEILPEVY